MNIVCEIVKDLIPLCVDCTASKMSSNMVHRHIKRCESCRAYYKMCKNSTDAEVLHEAVKGDKQQDLVYLQDDGYALIAERVEKRLMMERIAVISAFVGAIAATVLIFVLKDKKNR